MKYFLGIIVLLIFLFLPSNIQAAEIFTTEKLITVDIGKQQLTAWDNGKIVFQTPVSTGLSRTPTVKGSFKTYVKIPSQRMRGYSLVNGNYDHPNVPYVMYFHKDYGIHGAYWHNNFGRQMSNGCVNLPIAAAKWVYEWAPVGTRVEVF